MPVFIAFSVKSFELVSFGKKGVYFTWAPGLIPLMMLKYRTLP